MASNETSRPAVAAELPSTLYLETTNRCNSLCQTCTRTFRTLEPAADLTLERLTAVVDQNPNLRRVVLHGIGEPLLNRELFAMIDYLRQRPDISITFNSDAISLTRDMADKLLASPPDELRISLDAATPQTYKRVRGVDTFERVIANVASLREKQRERGKQLPVLSLWFTGMHTNIDELPALVQLAHDIDVRVVYLQRLVFYGHGLAVPEQAFFGHDDDKVQASVSRAEALAAQLGVIMHASGATEPMESLKARAGERPWSGCQRPWNVSYVTANGNVLPCCMAPWTAKDYGGALLGNAFEEPLADIWNGERYQKFRRQFESDEAPDPCHGCGRLWSY